MDVLTLLSDEECLSHFLSRLNVATKRLSTNLFAALYLSIIAS
jgi:hypothetical protein